MNNAYHAIDGIPGYGTDAKRWLRQRGYAWIPAPVLFIAVIALWFRNIQSPYESLGLLVGANLLLIAFPALWIALLFARSFLTTGALGIALFACGALFWSASGLATLGAAFWPASFWGVNTIATIHNLNVWAACLCCLAGAALLVRFRFTVGARALALFAVTSLTVVAAAFITHIAVQEWTPLFFMQGRGPTPERQLVLGSAIFAILLTIMLMRKCASPKTAFARWFGLALMLLAIGYLGIMLQSTLGGALGWVSRFSQYLGGLYMLVAAYAAFRGREAPFAIQGPPQDKPLHPYTVAIAIVLIATVLRVVFLSALQVRFGFITFFPAVMLAALYGGLRAGALATLCSVAFASSPSLVGGMTVLTWPQDWSATVIFILSCLLVSWLAETMEKAQTRLRRIEAERRAELERLVAARTAELRRAKNDAESATAELKAVFDAVPAGILIARGPSGRAMQGNRLGGAWASISPSEIFGKDGLALTREQLPLQRARRGEEVANCELEWRPGLGGRRSLYGNATPLRDAGGRLNGAVAAFIDITARKEAENALRESEDRLASALRAGKLGVHDYDPRTGRVKCDPQTYRLWGIPEGEEVTYETFEACVHTEDRGAVRAAFEKALTPGGGSRFECEYRAVNRADGSVRWIFADGDVTFDGGQAVRLVGTVHDITERKRYQEQIQLLMREVNHRAKNMLALVETVARRTAAGSPDDFVQRFSERIRALAASQDLLVKNEWKGADLRELVLSQLAHFKDLIGTRIELKGAPLVVCAHAAQTLGMALHELATNAGKYGALSTADGRVEIGWRLQSGERGVSDFVMSWQERDGPPAAPPAAQGFGSTVICRVVTGNLQGEVDLTYPPMGLVWRLKCPAAEVLAAGRFGG